MPCPASLRRLALPIIAILAVPAAVRAQSRWYLSALGTDTLSIEHGGNTITGLWVTYHAGGDRHREILRHEYTISLAPDGRPQQVRLALRVPGESIRRTFDARFTDDSAIIVVAPDSLSPHRLVARHAYPLLGASLGLAGALLGAMSPAGLFSDSTAVTVAPITGPFIAQPVPFFERSPGAWRLGASGAPTIFAAVRGVIDSVVAPNGSVIAHQVKAFDIDAVALAAKLSPPATPALPPPPPPPSTPVPREVAGALTGQWTQGGRTIPLSLSRTP